MKSWNEQGQSLFQTWAEGLTKQEPANFAASGALPDSMQGPLSQMTEFFNKSMEQWNALAQWPKDGKGSLDANALKKLFDPAEWGRAGGGRLRPRARASDRRTDLRDAVGSRPQAAERAAAFAAALARPCRVPSDCSGRVAIGLGTLFPQAIGRVAAADRECARAARPVGSHCERDADRDASHAQVP